MSESVKREMPLWRVYACKNADLVGRSVRAWTKGEARKLIRTQAGLTMLPQGTGLERVKESS